MGLAKSGTHYIGILSGSCDVIFSQSLQKVPTNTPTFSPLRSSRRIPAVRVSLHDKSIKPFHHEPSSNAS